MAFDGALGKAILFGGNAKGGNVKFRDTWEWDGATWSQAVPTRIPLLGARPMIWDPVRQRTWLILPGYPRMVGYYRNKDWLIHANIPSGVGPLGTGAFYPPDGKLVFLGNVTDLYDGTTWSSVPTPQDMQFAPMAYDETNRVLVGFGGVRFLNWTLLNNTMVFDGKAWRMLSVSGPPPRYLPSMAWDGRRRKILVHGGVSRSGTILGNTWEWDGSRWTQVGNGGPAVSSAGMVFDSVRGELVLFGGRTQAGESHQTYVSRCRSLLSIGQVRHGVRRESVTDA